VGGSEMNPYEFLQPDPRWAIWGCQTHEQYLEKYLLSGKFHSSVSVKIKEAYKTVERLIVYSYFYYPMEEEVGSKLTRIFEMAIRIRAQEHGIAIEKKNKTGKITPESLSALINKLKYHPSSHQEWAEEWVDFKNLRNLHAHPMGPNYGAAANLMLVAPMINVINSIFIEKEWFNAARDKVKVLQNKAEFYSKGVYVLDLSGRRLIITRAIPILVSHDERRSIWIMEPVGLQFPQNMEEYFSFNPIIIRLSDLYIDGESIKATDYVNDQRIIITPSDHPSDLAYTKNYFLQRNTAEEQVRIVYDQNFNYHLYYESQRFMYDEFWE